MKARIRHRYRRIKSWFDQPGGRGDIAAGLGVFALLVFGCLAVVERDRAADRAVDQREARDIAKRVVVLERQPTRQLIRRLERNLTLCRQFDECAAALDRETAPPKRQRRDRDEKDRAPDPRADRPPRAPAQPPSTPSPTPGGGGDDPPPPPPQAAAPVSPPSSSQPPPVDIDGPGGLLPQLLPDVNLPPVDVPPVRVP